MRLILLENQLDIKTGQNEKFDFVLKAAKSKLTFDQINEWINEHLK